MASLGWALSFIKFIKSPEITKKLMFCFLSDGDSGPGPFLEFRNPLKQHYPGPAFPSLATLPPPL